MSLGWIILACFVFVAACVVLAAVIVGPDEHD